MVVDYSPPRRCWRKSTSICMYESTVSVSFAFHPEEQEPQRRGAAKKMVTKKKTIEEMGGGECVAIVEVDGREKFSGDVVDKISRMEKKIFPKHESVARSLHEEVKKKNNGLLCARSVGGEVIGYVMYSWISSLCASITKLAVKENHRKQGHGESLLKAAISKCRTRNIHRISLHVDPSRTAAMSLYSKLGFQIEALIQCYYSPDRDAYRMFLEFIDHN